MYLCFLIGCPDPHTCISTGLPRPTYLRVHWIALAVVHIKLIPYDREGEDSIKAKQLSVIHSHRVVDDHIELTMRETTLLISLNTAIE